MIPSAVVNAAAARPYGQEVVGKRIKVYWPLDKAWYEGCVKSFDKESKKHRVQYDDAEEELLDLVNEKIEWIEERPRQLKRLRRGGGAPLEKAAVTVAENDESESNDGDDARGGDDDSSDEDWQSNDVEKEVEEDMGVDLVDEDEDDDGIGDGDDDDAVGNKSTGKFRRKSVSRKRKACDGGNKSGPAKKSNSSAGGLSKEGFKVSSAERGDGISECKW